jgi:hypothetical protein
MALLENPDIWIADTGATVHITSNEDGIDDAAACDVAVRVGNGKIAESAFKGSLRVDACDRTGTVTGRGVLSKVHVVPEAPYNLCSISQCMEHGWTLGGTKEAGIWLEKDSFTLRFDIRLDTPEGVVWCACLRRVISEISCVGTPMKQISIQKAHQCLGHMGEMNTRAVSNILGWQITRGSLTSCEDCAIGKGRQKISLRSVVAQLRLWRIQEHI